MDLDENTTEGEKKDDKPKFTGVSLKSELKPATTESTSSTEESKDDDEADIKDSDEGEKKDVASPVKPQPAKIVEERKEEPQTDTALLEELTSFLDTDKELYPILCGYFNKVMQQGLLSKVKP